MFVIRLSSKYDVSGLSYTFHVGINGNMSSVVIRILNASNGIDDTTTSCIDGLQLISMPIGFLVLVGYSGGCG